MKTMYTLADVKAAANGNWEAILSALGVPQHLLNKNKHQPCPACGGKNRFRFTDNGGRGWFICNQCNQKGGSGFDLLMLVFGCTFDEALKRVAELLGMSGGTRSPALTLPARETAPPTVQTDENQRQRLLECWNGCQSWQSGGVIAAYLSGRGIPEAGNLPFQDDGLRFHSSLAYWHQGACLGRFPAMVGAFRHADGTFAGLHLTYLMQQGGKVFKAVLKDPKTGERLDAKKHRSIHAGALSGAAVPLFGLPENGCLAVCEGIETAAAAHCVSGLSVWACGAANRIAAFALPEAVRRLVVIADNDRNQTGINAAYQLQRRYYKALNGNIDVWQPDEADCDVLDILAQETQGK
ncbi:toprim domain-containing protein [Conchiformibius steedae DSM 2580]|uniref:Toprim domain-containing protein n=1 Tax=Conchiformibius steedae DSM 2580 TaxID=1121352 RepID=A0AAE9HXI2_9NEIS|nr:toprim domain-containing protein [Conchiformibius steedae]QMT34128.1 toprim domain-containing protein [Conchiformibius steedae]URD66901.1 toprim domain-containing protein [Conchiformibius steedae DSM 2580]